MSSIVRGAPATEKLLLKPLVKEDFPEWSESTIVI